MPDGSSSNLRTGGQILVDCLRLHGVDTVFCVPGESYLATLDAFHDVHDKIELVVCRQEGGVTNMADAWGKMTGKPGIAFVTRGPGATNASVGIHTAHQDLDSADIVRRADRPRYGRARSLPGSRLPPHVR